MISSRCAEIGSAVSNSSFNCCSRSRTACATDRSMAALRCCVAFSKSGPGTLRPNKRSSSRASFGRSYKRVSASRSRKANSAACGFLSGTEFIERNSSSSRRQCHFDARTAQGRVFYGDGTAVQPDEFPHHGQTYALTAHSLIQSRASRQHVRALLSWHTGTVIFHDESQAIPTRLRRSDPGGAQLDSRTRPL